MSINVHVTGNPISIKRGKMVTSDFDQCKNEFDKRRLMRLEQVRQQSKDIAEGLRNKVKKEKKVQMKEIEEEGKQKLKNWQNRKLLELQNQYQDALKELGVAHRAAQTIGDENEIIAEQELLNNKKADKRGKVAGGKLCEEKIKEELDKARQDERRKFVREIENARAQMITSPKPKRPKVREKQRKSDGDISITVCDSDEGDSESDLSESEDSGEIEESSSCPCLASNSKASLTGNVSKRDFSATKHQEEKPPSIVPPLNLPQDDSPINFIPPNSPSEPPTLSSPRKPRQTYGDTRISDRIKRRDGVCTDKRDIKSPEPTRIPLVESRTDVRDFIRSRRCHTDCICCCKRRGHHRTADKQVETEFKEDHGTQTSENYIPSHPSVIVKDKQSKSSLDGKPSGSKVKVYDHPNRFTSEKSIPFGSMVEKIPLESLEYMTDQASEEDRQEAIKRRDRDAQIRGKKALEKEKLQREYEEMLKKLPLLQKKERICEIYNDKPEYHMSDERLKEKERVKQNNLENAYAKLFPNLKPATVTLPKTAQTNDEGSSNDNENSVHSLNTAEWDVDNRVPNKFSSKEVQDIIKGFIKRKPRDRRSTLRELLKNLNIQKEELLNAIAALPQNDTIEELINDLRSFSDTDARSKSKSSKSNRKRRKDNEADTSIDSSQESSSKDVKGVGKESSSRGVGKSPRKKAKTKTRPNVIILQNTSTQTTPKSSKQVTKVSEGVMTDETKKHEKICDKLHVPCDCNKENQETSDDLCHIFIKLSDDDVPEVLVKSKEKEKSSKTALTKHTTIGTQMSPDATIRTQKPPETIKKPPHKPKPRPPERKTAKADPSAEKSRTWRDQLSKNSISTTSTSYLSPPDFHRSKNSEKSSFYNQRSKPHKDTLSSAFTSTKYDSMNQSTDPLKPYVKQLLSMSKGIVDNMSVSTSNVETPSQSIIEMDTNVPKQELMQLVEQFKGTVDDIATRLQSSPDISAVPFNTSATSSGKSCNQTDCRPVYQENTSSSSGQVKEDLVAQYAKVSDSVTKRIATLTKMIEDLRNEKIKMLQSSKSKSFQDRDFSTRYMDLPELRSSSSSSKSSSSEEEEILKKLMEIDQSVVEKMGKIRQQQQHQRTSKDAVDRSEDSVPKPRDLTSPNSTNQEIIDRLQRLKDQDQPPNSTKSQQQSFVPFLSDIPKLPKFEPQTDSNQLHKRPPPSKGLAAAKKFNGNISLVPHELSTIVEGDSQMSKVPSPETSDMNLNVPLLTIPEAELESGSGKSLKYRDCNKSSSSSKERTTSTKDDSMKSCDELPSSILGSSSSSSSGNRKKCDDSTCGAISLQHFSSSSSDDVENIEAMLRSIGMEWAIPTLYKTQEALALGSNSSSSLDVSNKKKKNQSDGSGSASEISLRDYLRKKVLKVSASTMLSDTTPPSFLGDQTELSGIVQCLGNSSVDKSRQRTSTPINDSKSTSKSKAVFTDSDLSSIKQEKRKS